MSVETDLSLAARILRRGAWFTVIGVRSLCSHYFPTDAAGKAKKLSLCGRTSPGVADGDPAWRCRGCARRLELFTRPARAPSERREYAS